MNRKINRSEFYLLIFSTVVTILLALLLIRWLAPTLLGLPGDMVLVKSSKEVAPYFEHVFDRDMLYSKEFILNDPVVRVRGKPLLPHLGGIGPNDILGFRNKSVPNDADIIIIGDSQTYGNNVLIWDNWPHQLRNHISGDAVVYSMAIGGWGALQYYYALAKALVFRPRLVIIAFYTGNDPAETFSLAQASEIWSEFIPPDTNLKKYKLPEVNFPAPPEEQWKVDFPDGITTVFTPQVRHASNAKTESVDIAYGIMVNVAKKIYELSKNEGVEVFFTIIPTKEYVYAKKVIESNIPMNESYNLLIEDESDRIDSFSMRLDEINSGHYIDIANGLQREALKPLQLYPTDINGHPLTPGYGIIADEISKKIQTFLQFNIKNGFYIFKTMNDLYFPVLVRDGSFWIVLGDDSVIADRIRKKGFTVLDDRILFSLRFAGNINIKEALIKSELPVAQGGDTIIIDN